MVNRDINSLFWNIVGENEFMYIFIDFIEERFDLLEYEGGYITESDAFDGTGYKLDGFRKVERDSKECMELWKDSFRKFVEAVENKMRKCRIVVVENYLSEAVGTANEKRYFENKDEIQRINQILRKYYIFVKDNFEHILFIEEPKSDYYYTDIRYEYGAIPSHLNEVVNLEIAGMIDGIIKSESRI